MGPELLRNGNVGIANLGNGGVVQFADLNKQTIVARSRLRDTSGVQAAVLEAICDVHVPRLRAEVGAIVCRLAQRRLIPVADLEDHGIGVS
jgi:hypothetical protein